MTDAPRARLSRSLGGRVGRVALVAARAAMVALAALAVVAGVLIGRAGRAGAERYVCPMHPEVISAGPSDCPICGMALERARPAGPASEAAPRDRLALGPLRRSAEAASLLRLSVAPVRRNALPSEIYAPARAEADGVIIARLYRDELAALEPDEAAEYAAGAGASRRVRRTRTPAPPGDPREPTVRVELRVEPGEAPPPPGEVGWVKLAYRSRAMLVVRSASVLPSPDGPYVLVLSADHGSLSRRRITVGKEYDEMTAVVAGLRDKELVVMSNAHAFDAELRLEAAR